MGEFFNRIGLKKIIGIALGIVAIVGLGWYLVSRPTNVLKSKDADITFSGYNGSGSANMSHSDKWAQDIFDATAKRYKVPSSIVDSIELNASNVTSFSDYSNLTNSYLTENSTTLSSSDRDHLLILYHALEATKIDIKGNSSNLSNGDKVLLKLSANSNKAIKSGERTFKVKGLKKATELTAKDIEKHVSLKVTGLNHHGSAELKVDSVGQKYGLTDLALSDKYSPSGSTDPSLSNGDKVKMYDTGTIKSQLAEGYVLKGSANRSEKVSGLKDISKLDYSALKNDADTVFAKVEEDNKDNFFNSMEGIHATLKQVRYKSDALDSMNLNEESDNGKNHGKIVMYYDISYMTEGDDVNNDKKVKKEESEVISFDVTDKNGKLINDNKPNASDMSSTDATLSGFEKDYSDYDQLANK
ncbi:hypothetical protein D3P96_07690 [Weissella viridescens]|uniref:Uncharacterized protein n=1 Tax=Weissella viridescens TaxID=1629 RepID=A0A3P2R9I4_WEIVI|nr:hypothetical protein [Weissella viridescens]RRG17427.1 hypothetical protein D3P96_07690 [Weissella viridescens]